MFESWELYTNKASVMLVKVRSNKTVKYSNVNAVWSCLLGCQSTLAQEPCSSRPDGTVTAFNFANQKNLDASGPRNSSKAHFVEFRDCVRNILCLCHPWSNFLFQQLASFQFDSRCLSYHFRHQPLANLACWQRKYEGPFLFHDFLFL